MILKVENEESVKLEVFKESEYRFVYLYGIRKQQPAFNEQAGDYNPINILFFLP
ncbi:MAG: hypothetical protein ABI480_08485 [Chitinophagaceae bacterium]